MKIFEKNFFFKFKLKKVSLLIIFMLTFGNYFLLIVENYNPLNALRFQLHRFLFIYSFIYLLTVNDFGTTLY